MDARDSAIIVSDPPADGQPDAGRDRAEDRKRRAERQREYRRLGKHVEYERSEARRKAQVARNRELRRKCREGEIPEKAYLRPVPWLLAKRKKLLKRCERSEGRARMWCIADLILNEIEITRRIDAGELPRPPHVPIEIRRPEPAARGTARRNPCEAKRRGKKEP